jgi:outer membrane protein assembly factor BamA
LIPGFSTTQFNLRARLFSAVRDEEGYSKNELGARVDVGHRLFKRVEAAIFVQGETVTVSNASIDPALLGPTNYTLTSVGFTQTTDYRDNPINPGRGWVFTSSFDVADIDGQAGFLRGTARFSIYQPVGRKCLLALGARVGGLKPIAPSIPIDTRFSTAAEPRCGAFPSASSGPKDKQGNPLGGEFYTVVNAEFTFPIYRGFEGAAIRRCGQPDRLEQCGFLRHALCGRRGPALQATGRAASTRLRPQSQPTFQ